MKLIGLERGYGYYWIISRKRQKVKELFMFIFLFGCIIILCVAHIWLPVQIISGRMQLLLQST